LRVICIHKAFKYEREREKKYPRERLSIWGKSKTVEHQSMRSTDLEVLGKKMIKKLAEKWPGKPIFK
jgi:hypothetical protein